MKQADRSGADVAVILDEEGAGTARDMETRRPAAGRPGDAGGGPRVSEFPALAPNGYRDTWCGQVLDDRVDQTVRVAGWVHRRRDHGGLIFIDLRDRTGLVQLVFNPDAAGAAQELGPQAARRGRDQRLGRGRAPQRRDRQPRAADRRVRAARGRGRAARRRRDPAVRDRGLLGRGGGGASPALPLPRPAARADARRADPAPPRDPRRSGEFLDGRGLPRHRDAGAHPVDPRGRPRLPRPEPPPAGLVLRAPAVAAALQAAADGRRASSATTRSPAASATRTCAPTASSTSPSSTSRCRSSRSTT